MHASNAPATRARAWIGRGRILQLGAASTALPQCSVAPFTGKCSEKAPAGTFRSGSEWVYLGQQKQN
jgi:hypothetical protein